MRKSLFYLLGFVLFSGLVQAQTSSLKGSVTDTADKKNLQNTVISLLREKDSALVRFTRADKAGNFSINNLKPGKYIVMITHPYVGDYFDGVEIKADMATDLGNVIMIPKTKLLAEVILKSGSPIRIRGDTTIYTADSFKVRAGANVEELLRRLPGIQVDKSGQITAMGERVKKVLVDGEEFFGSDPGIATKNLRADAVKEVQVFDKKSDQAEFTGIDDGVRDKTINLKMKEMKGYFGKIELGGGLKDKFNNDAMINAFKGKRKMAAYGIMSNTGQTNLDWKDAQNYGGGEMDGMSTGVSDDGGMYVSWNGGGEDSYWGGRNGIPQNWNAGLHYSNKFNKDKLSFNSGYKFSKVNAPSKKIVVAENFLPDSSWHTNTLDDKFTSTRKNAFNLTLDGNIDSSNSIKWTTRFNTNDSRNSSNYYSESIDDLSRFINNSTRNSTNHSEKNNITSSVLWRHKFKKLSRTLSVNADLMWNDLHADGLLYSLDSFFLHGVFIRKDTTDQQNIQNSVGKSITTKVAFTEPLAKDVYLEFSYAINIYHNGNDRITSIKSPTGKYDEVLDTLSNSFVFNRMVNTPGLNFRVNKKKYNYSFGSSVGFSHFQQKNLTEGTTTDYTFTNFFPRVTFVYKFKGNETLRLNYNGVTTPPSIEQMQPTRINTDPLNVYIGNPDLDQSFRHSINGGYNFYNVLKERNLFTNFNFSTTQNAFTQLNVISPGGKRTYQTVNTDGNFNLNFYSSYGIKITKAKLGIGIGPTANMSRNIDYVKQEFAAEITRNVTDTRSYGVSINVDKYVPNKYNFYFGPSITWNHSKASVNSASNAKYWMLNCWGQGTVNLPKKFEISSDVNVQVRQKDPRFTQNTNYTTWNMSVIKRMLKDNKLEVKLGLYDILDQNRGYQRNFNSYSFTETYYNTLRRFWLLTVTWNLSKNGKAPGWE
ncbi:MAG: TonB-dependent receptor [Chitinophagales bacterium]